MNYKRLLIVNRVLIASNIYRALPDNCAQLIVAAPDWNAVHGRLYLLDKIDGKWRANADSAGLVQEKWAGLGVGSLVRMNLACENMNEMVERPRAHFSESAVYL